MSPLGFLSICGGTRSTVLSYFFIYLLFVAVFFFQLHNLYHYTVFTISNDYIGPSENCANFE